MNHSNSSKNKLRLLDLFCGAVGAGMGYANAGFEITGVDIQPPKILFTLSDARHAMGAGWMNMKELSQAIPPAYTEYIGLQLRMHLLLQVVSIQRKEFLNNGK